MEQAGSLLDKPYRMKFHTSKVVEDHWSAFEPALLRGKNVWGDYETLESLRENFRKGAIQMWTLSVGPVIKLLTISRIEQYATGRREMVLQYLIGEGFFEDPELMKSLSENFEVFARISNCTSIRINAIPALMKPLKAMGYTAGVEVAVWKNIEPKERMH